LFIDFQFNALKENMVTILEINNGNIIPTFISQPIIKFGRTENTQNNIEESRENAVSRRHYVIINSKDNIWLYDIDSTSTNLNDEEVTNKAPSSGFNKLEINSVYFIITTDTNKLI